MNVLSTCPFGSNLIQCHPNCALYNNGECAFLSIAKSLCNTDTDNTNDQSTESD